MVLDRLRGTAAPPPPKKKKRKKEKKIEKSTQLHVKLAGTGARVILGWLFNFGF